jgi:hypothetical protein
MTNRYVDRRSFLRTALLGGTALGLAAPRLSWADVVTGKPASGKIGDFKISLAQWSLNK